MSHERRGRSIMIIKKITAAAAVLAMLADSFSAVSVTGKAAEIPEPVWSADFESVVTDQDHVVEVSPNRGYAQVVDHDQKGFDMTVERSYNGTKALRINGDDYLTITGENGTAPITGSDTGVTLNYWVKVNGGSVSWSFFEKKDATVTKDRYYLGMINNSSKLRWETQNYRNNAVETTSNNLGSTWHMVSATYGEDGSFVYLDGKPVASKPDAWAAYGPLDGMIGDQPTAYIGYAQSWGEHAELSLDNYKIFDQQLSANQIAAIYEGEMSSLKTGVYLDGKEMKDFDTAMNQVIGDPTGTYDCSLF